MSTEKHNGTSQNVQVASQSVTSQSLNSAPPPVTSSDYESGVSNGDVDWLFRGKASKKLAKKKPEVGKEVNLTFNKQNIDGNKEAQQQRQQPQASKLSEQLINEKERAEAAKKTEPLKPAIVNSGAFENISTRARSSSDSGRAFADNTRSASESRTPLPNTLPRHLQRRSSEASVSVNAKIAVESQQAAAAPAKKNLLSSISSKFAKPSSAASSPVLSSPLQQSTTANHSIPAMNINYAKKGQSPVASSTSPPEAKGLFGLRRKLSVSKSGQPPPLAKSSLPSSHPSKTVEEVAPKQTAPQHRSTKDIKKAGVEELLKTKLRRVTFALNELKDDPQQQIPSRNPKRGNVLVPDDILAEPARLSIGIADSTNTISQSKKPNSHDKEELALAYEAQREALIESEKHAQEAHSAAQRMAREVSQFKLSKSSKFKEDIEEDEGSNYVHTPSHLMNIDNPLHHHIDYFADAGSDAAEPGSVESEAALIENELADIPLETIYTRCCHLREILPIPATLKQLKNKSKPLTVLKMLNPKPTLIDILSFSDFLAITPIVTIIFDNVTIDTEMLKIVLSSISNSVFLEKLSLRNVAIDSEGWLYLCKFLTLSKSLIKLDISQQKIKSDTPKSMNRSEMNWDLFSESLVRRGGLEELVINGCKITDEQFNKLVEHGISISTKRLGVAATNLNVAKCESLAKWITKDDSTCIGIDIAFNDMRYGQLKPFIDGFKESTKLVFFSLNSTKVSVSDCESMIKTLSSIKTLRFLDLSNIPHCFPAIISVLAEWLPKFQDLRRIHFELDELTAPELVAIANILPHCKNLIHISFLGHKDINYATAVALYGAIKLSSIYTLDIDYDLIPEDLSSKIALYLMINMEKSMNKDLQFEYERTDEELIADGSLITQAAEKLLENSTPTEPSVKKSEEIYSKEIIKKALIEKTSRVRKDIHKQMDKLFDLRMRGELSLEGKETLIRFSLLDSSLEKVVNIFEEEEQSKNAASAAVASHSNNAEEEHLHKVSSDILETGPIVSPNLQTSAHQNSYFPALQHHQIITTEQPHLVVADSNKEGEDIPIDQSTGRPVLFRKLSHTSEHAKKQEEEEGEFHRWGFFMQQQNQLYAPSTEQGSPVLSENKSSLQAHATPQQAPSAQFDQVVKSATPPQQSKKLHILPSGPELREVILKAKGLQKVSDLIDKFNADNNEHIQIEDLYKNMAIDKDQLHQSPKLSAMQNKKEQADDAEVPSDSGGGEGRRRSSIFTSNDSDYLEPESPRSINSFELDEAYDMLLNDVDKVRSNKG